MNAAEEDWLKLAGRIETRDLSQDDEAEMIRRAVAQCLGPKTLNGVWWEDVPEADPEKIALKARLKDAYTTAYQLIAETSWYLDDRWPPANTPCPNYHQPAPTFSLRHWLSLARKHHR